MYHLIHMHIVDRIKTSKCIDGNIVSEYTLSKPIDSAFLSILDMMGLLSIKKLGNLQMFTYREDDWLTIKGMTGDTMLYVTHLKSKKERTEERITFFLEQYRKEEEG